MTMLLSLLAALTLAQAGAETAPPPGQTDLVTLGEADAPVIVHAYMSPTCPHCADFYRDALPLIEKDLIEPGKMQLIIRGLPSQPVGMSVAGMMVIECAPDSRAAADRIFNQQHEWIEQAKAGDPKLFLEETAAEAGLSGEETETCMTDQALAESLYNGGGAAADAYGFTGVPSFLVNGEPVGGDKLTTIDDWRAVVEAASDE